MKIVHLYDGHEKVYDGRGSVPDVVWKIASESSQNGHNVTVIERKWKDTPTNETIQGVHFQRLPLTIGSNTPWEDIPFQMVRSPLGVAKLGLDRIEFSLKAVRKLNKLEPDIIHTHLPFSALLIAYCLPKYRNRIIYTTHIGETEERVSKPFYSPDVELAKRSAKTIVLNQKMRNSFVERGVSNNKIAVIPNGVDLSKRSQTSSNMDIREKYNITSHNIALFVGTVTKRKGVLDLIEAIARKDNIDDTQFLLVGKTDLDNEYFKKVKRKIKEHNLDSQITFTGFVPNETLYSIYESSTFFVFPSYEEGSSIAVSEAIAFGLPIIATSIPGNSEKVQDKTHGFLYEPGNIQELAEYLTILSSNSDLQKEIESEVQKQASQLSWENIIKKIERVYMSVIRNTNQE